MSDAHHPRSPETWAAVRDAYLGGVSAPDLCERYDLARSTFFARAAAEGWRRADQPDPAPDPEFKLHDLVDAGQPLRSPQQLADAAWLGADRAIARGRAADAERWMRLHRQYRALAKEAEADARRERLQAADGVIATANALTAAAVAGRRETEAAIMAFKAGLPLDGLDSLDRPADGPRASPAQSPAAQDVPDERVRETRAAQPTPDPHRLKRHLLQAAIEKAARQGDRAAGARLRAKLDALDSPDRR